MAKRNTNTTQAADTNTSKAPNLPTTTGEVVLYSDLAAHGGPQAVLEEFTKEAKSFWVPERTKDRPYMEYAWGLGYFRRDMLLAPKNAVVLVRQQSYRGRTRYCCWRPGQAEIIWSAPVSVELLTETPALLAKDATDSDDNAIITWEQEGVVLPGPSPEEIEAEKARKKAEREAAKAEKEAAKEARKAEREAKKQAAQASNEQAADEKRAAQQS